MLAKVERRSKCPFDFQQKQRVSRAKRFILGFFGTVQLLLKIFSKFCKKNGKNSRKTFPKIFSRFSVKKTFTSPKGALWLLIGPVELMRGFWIIVEDLEFFRHCATFLQNVFHLVKGYSSSKLCEKRFMINMGISSGIFRHFTKVPHKRAEYQWNYPKNKYETKSSQSLCLEFI